MTGMSLIMTATHFRTKKQRQLFIWKSHRHYKVAIKFIPLIPLKDIVVLSLNPMCPIGFLYNFP